MFSPRRPTDIECGIVCTVRWIQNDPGLEPVILLNELASLDAIIALLIGPEKKTALVFLDRMWSVESLV